MRIAILANVGFILLGAFLFIASAVDVLSQGPIDVAEQPARLTVTIVLAVVGVGLVIVGVLKQRRLLRQWAASRGE